MTLVQRSLSDRHIDRPTDLPTGDLPTGHLPTGQPTGQPTCGHTDRWPDLTAFLQLR